MPADAEKYEVWFETPFGRRADRVEREILRCQLSHLSEARSLLDVGGGTGHFVDLWRSVGLVTTNIDRSLEVVVYARDRHPGLSVLVGDALHLPFPDRAFDLAALVTVLEFLDDPTQGLREAARVARRGLLLGVLSSASPIAWWRKARGRPTYRCATFFSPRGLGRLVRRTLADRVITTNWETGLFPFSCLDDLRELPFGAFIGMTVRLG
jgi:ubiquinone/menaquinone biosynthesis C-methylase UbiE